MAAGTDLGVLPRWSGRRIVLASVGAGLALMLIGVATGFVAAHLDHGTGQTLWRTRLGWVVLIGPAAALLAGGAWLWRRSRRVERDLAPGEARAVRRSRGFWTVLGVQVVLGALVGAFGAHALLNPGALPAAATAWLALALAAVTVVGTVWGCVALWPRMDELELQDNLWAGCLAAGLVATVYPAWYFLWRGGWVREPAHEALFLLLLAAMMAVYGWRKSRRG